MNSSVGQKVYVKGNINNFRLLSYSGEVVFIDNIQQLVLVRFRNNETAFFSEDNLSLTFVFPPLSSIIGLIILVTLISFSFAFVANFYWQ